ncbi:MAG: lipid-A-disaccharide synthase N-terminal domain-containing protein [bacterium]|nr:lipid-A-disaccharide synthase N-terminal domain-containing protein [bacterium]
MFPLTIFGFVVDGWVLFGFAAQFLFFLRMLVQWISSERAGKSVIPIAYWYLSFVGNTMLIVYAIKIKDPVFSTGQFIGFIYYSRNIFLARKGSSDTNATNETQ